jgi:hypothetical protein
VVRRRVLRLLERRGVLPAQGPEDAQQAYQAQLHRAGTVTACGVGASASDKPHEVPRRLRSKRATAAISGPPSRGETGAGGEPGLCHDGGGAEEGAHPGLDWAGLLSRTESAGRVRLLEVWRQEAGLGVREGSRRGESDSGALGLPTMSACLAPAL